MANKDKQTGRDKIEPFARSQPLLTNTQSGGIIMLTKQLKLTGLVLLSTTLIGACSSSSTSTNGAVTPDTGSTTGDTTAPTNDTSGDSTTPDNSDPVVTSGINKIGIVGISYDATVDVDETTAFASFVGFETAIQESFVQTALTDALDSCEVTTSDADDFFDPSDIVPGIDPEDIGAFTSLSAGDVLTMTSDAGSYTELAKQSQFGLTLYGILGESLPGAAPDNLILDIPGDEFPAYSNVALPNVPAINLTAPASLADLTLTSTFTWNGSNDPENVVMIDIYSFDLETFQSTEISCMVTDDGSFALPAGLEAQIGEDFFPDSLDVTRATFDFVPNNDALLIIARDSMVTLESDFFGGFPGIDDIPNLDAVPQ